MSLIKRLHGGVTGSSVFLPYNIDQLETIKATKPCYAGIRIAADGDVYALSAAGVTWQRVGTWLLVGASSAFYVSRSIDQGTLSTDAGAGPLVCSTNRDYKIINVTHKSTEIASITLDIASDVSGAPIVATRSYTLSANIL
jgi:hypothetical protein